MAGVLLLIIYVSFISLGLPDTLLGSGWPTMYGQLGVSVGDAGILTMVCGVGTICSTLCSQHLIARFGTGKVTAGSTALTAVGLLCFSVSGKFWMLCVCMIPLGLGAGCVDAALNNYVALHYESRHMSWLHCMWGVGTTVSPYIMGAVLAAGASWRLGYRTVGFLQLGLSAILFVTLPLWTSVRVTKAAVGTEVEMEVLPLRKTIAIPGVKAAVACFFLYCALEQTAGLWASSYLRLYRGISADAAARFASLYFLGITAGRGLSGLLTLRFTDRQLIRMGLAVILVGVLCVLLPVGNGSALLGFVLMGLGSGPIYPCMVHSTPVYFGESRCQAVIGVQMTGAFLGSCLMPPLFGVMAESIHIKVLPLQLLLLLGLLTFAHMQVENRHKVNSTVS